MVGAAIKPTRSELDRLTGGNHRMTRAFELLFESLDETKGTVETQGTAAADQSDVINLQGAAINGLQGDVVALENATVPQIAALTAAAGQSAPSAVWYDFNNAQAVPANTWTALDWTSPTVQTDELADDMESGFVAGGMVKAPDRDWFVMRVDVKFSADDAVCNYVRFGLRDPNVGGFGVFTSLLHPAILGAGIADEATFQVLTFGTSLIPQGFEPVILADGPITITATQGFFARVGSFA